MMERILHDVVKDSSSEAETALSTDIVIIDNKDKLMTDNPQDELIRWHYCLGYLPLFLMRIMALLGIILRRLIHSKTPKCAGYLYRDMK